jgi:hypothetical protein
MLYSVISFRSATPQRQRRPAKGLKIPDHAVYDGTWIDSALMTSYDPIAALQQTTPHSITSSAAASNAGAP